MLKKVQLTLATASFWAGIGVATVAHLAGRAMNLTLESTLLPIIGGVLVSMALILYPEKPPPTPPPAPPAKGTRAKP